MSKEQKVRKEGVVVGDSMDKTVAVEVEWLESHPLYKKEVRKVSKFLAHDPEDEYEVGDKVIIEETKPISKKKTWQVIKPVEEQ